MGPACYLRFAILVSFPRSFCPPVCVLLMRHSCLDWLALSSHVQSLPSSPVLSCSLGGSLPRPSRAVLCSILHVSSRASAPLLFAMSLPLPLIDAAQQPCLACLSLTCPILAIVACSLIFPRGVPLPSVSYHRSFHPAWLLRERALLSLSSSAPCWLCAC